MDRGKFGVVYKCDEKRTSKVSAVKVMYPRQNKRSDVEREVAILKELKHPHLLEFRSFTEEDGTFILVTELWVQAQSEPLHKNRI